MSRKGYALTIVLVLTGGLILAYLASIAYYHSAYYKASFSSKFEQVKAGDSETHIRDLLGRPSSVCATGHEIRDPEPPFISRGFGYTKNFDYEVGSEHFVVRFGGFPENFEFSQQGVVSGTEVSAVSVCGQARIRIDEIAVLAILICWLGSITCWIFVLVKLFKNEGLLKGFLGLFIPLYAFIWGWINARRLKLRLWMWLWTILFLVGCSAIGALGNKFK